MTQTPTAPTVPTDPVRRVVLGLQHSIAMFGATVLVPILVGLSPSVALFGAGVATLLFHLLTGGRVPIFLGSSFAFIAPTALVVKEMGAPAAAGGLIAAGALFLLFAGLVKPFGTDRLTRLFPPIVAGPVIFFIGVGLSSGPAQPDKIHSGLGPGHRGLDTGWLGRGLCREPIAPAVGLAGAAAFSAHAGFAGVWIRQLAPAVLCLV